MKNNPATIMAQLIALLQQSRHAELEDVASAHLAQHSADGTVWKILGVSRKLHGHDPYAALAALEKAALLLPADAEAHVNVALTLAGLGRPAEAATSLRRALALTPAVPALHNHLGRCLAQSRQFAAAADSYRHALDLQPDFVEAHNNLGTALRELGQCEAALNSYRMALQWQPLAAALHGNMAQTLTQLGRTDEAIACYRRAIELQPDFAVMHYQLGVALIDRGNLMHAVDCMRSALRIQPEFAEASNQLGAVLRDLGELDEAEACCRRALQRKPDLIEAYVNMANVLRLQSRSAEAEACCRRALEVAPNSAPCMACLANILTERGQFGAAETLYRQAFGLAPEFAEAWASIPLLRKMTHDDAAWLQAAETVAAQNLTPRRAAYLHFGIGKYFDDTGNVESAFAHYRLAHEHTRRYGPEFDPASFDAMIDTIINVMSSAWVGKTREHANASARPVFVIGMPRSGTSLAEQIMAAHPGGFGAGELMYWRNACERYPMAQLVADQNSDAILRQLADGYVALLKSHSANALRVVDKMPSNFMFAGVMCAAFPHARFIHMQRHLIDTCLSIYFQHFDTPHSYADDLENMAHFYQGYLRLMAHWRSVLPAGSMLEVPYESLVSDPEIWSRKMIDFIGLPWDARCLDFHQAERSVSTASKWQVRQAINRNSVERWRKYEKFVGPLLPLL